MDNAAAHSREVSSDIRVSSSTSTKKVHPRVAMSVVDLGDNLGNNLNIGQRLNLRVAPVRVDTEKHIWLQREGRQRPQEKSFPDLWHLRKM